MLYIKVIFCFCGLSAYKCASFLVGDRPSLLGIHFAILIRKFIAPKMSKLISFYLPQYHPIPENDEWWGEGFTEWSNVRRAVPLYEGHYQPHVPLDAHYYSLDNPENQLRQINLAKQYGVDGFCFYFYWFNGKTLLETPTRRWLENKDLDFPFCLCWANENWTRRWDGLDKQMLIGQSYSPKDDRDFINYISCYLKDPRYIRINGKPLVVLYRPNLLPNALFTASQWRYECMINGVGEIHLAYVQGFEKSDPGKYGFDSAIEFPPVGLDADNITCHFSPLKEFKNSPQQIYDYKSFVAYSNKYESLGYTLFRGVMPSWDNTARRMTNGASIIHHSTPELFKEWLLNASMWSKTKLFVQKIPI